MKLLVDCSPLSQGGGVQAAIAFLANLQERSDIVWQAVLPESLRPFLPIEVAADARMSFVRKRSGLHNVAVGRVLLKIERTFSPDVVFTVFGPAYFRARACHVVGFAMPNLVYEPDGPLGSRTISDRLGNWIRRVMPAGGSSRGRDRDDSHETIPMSGDRPEPNFRHRQQRQSAPAA